MKQRSPLSILIAIVLWIGIAACIVAIAKYLVLPQVNRLRSDYLAGQTGSDGQYDHVVRLGLDSFSGYCVLRSDAFNKRLKEQSIKLVLKDDGANYQSRLKALQRGKIQMAVFPVNSFIQCGAEAGDFPATIAYVLDETVGADAIIAYREDVENIQGLNHRDARIVLTPDSPSEFLARVMLANFNLPEFPEKKWMVHSVGSQDVFKKFEAGAGKKHTAYAMWEPEVTRALRDPRAQVLLDSSMVKGYIVDVLVVERGFLLENYEVVKAFIESYSRTAYLYQDNMTKLVMEDAQATGHTISSEAALEIVKGIQWKNTLENYAHFGLQPSFHSFDNMEDIIIKVTDVLMKTGVFKSNPTEGKLETLYYDRILLEMKSDGFSNQMQEAGMRDRSRLRPLSEAEWNQLKQVGEFKVNPIQFGRGTSRLNVQSQHDLRKLAATLNSWPEYYILVTGQVRAGDGNEQAALELAQSRAREAVQLLVENGVDSDRIRHIAELGVRDSIDSQSVSFVVGKYENLP